MYEIQFVITDGPRENVEFNRYNHRFLKIPYLPRIDDYIRIGAKEYKVWKVAHSFFNTNEDFSSTDCWMFQTSLED